MRQLALVFIGSGLGGAARFLLGGCSRRQADGAGPSDPVDCLTAD